MRGTPRLDRLRRPIDPARHVAEIDGLRMLAIGVVVVGHILAFAAPMTARVAGLAPDRDPLRWIRGEGPSGVMLFFAISGFVLMLPFARAAQAGDAPPSVRDYYRRRLTRLEPPYLLTLVALFGLLILLDGWAAGDLGGHLLAGLPYTHVMIFGIRNPINPVTWSLEVEVQFYLLMPLLAWGLLRMRPTTRRVALLAVVVAMPIAQQLTDVFATPRLGMSLIGSLQFFAIGIWAADLFVTAPPAEGSSRWDLAFVVGLVPFLVIREAVPGGLPVALTPACAVLLLGALRGRRVRAALRTPWIVVVGGMCYSIYLLHYQLVRGLWRWTRPFVVPALGVVPNLLVQVAIHVTLVLVVSGLFFALIERPCMRRDWPQRAIARWRGAGSRTTIPQTDDLLIDRRSPATLDR